jgi:hypothetical protein
VNVVPITVDVFGTTLKILLPGSRVTTFLLGVVFWIVMGPIVKVLIRKAIEESTGGKNAIYQKVRERNIEQIH